MTIPLATTKISILRVSGGSADPYDAQPAASVVASGIRAHISTSSGTETLAGGSQEVTEFRLAADPCALDHLDVVLDEVTSERYSVVWTRRRPGIIPALDHVQAGLKRVEGFA